MDGLFAAWKAVATVKPRVVKEAEYTKDMLATFLCHRDALRITRDDLIRWRTETIAGGLNNDTWNNRLSMLRQVFKQAVADGKLFGNPTDGLRLPKARPNSWLPYSDDEAALILKTARGEQQPSLRWGHWVMAFTGMRVAEVLQLTGSDIRREGSIDYIAVNEDEPGKSVKNS
jgi:site-specific recombinase XerD